MSEEQLETQATEPEPIDVSKFKPINPTKELVEILGLTIKEDVVNKVVTFLCELSAYTESAQFNISYNAPSSTGKSYIPTEIARLFPQEDLMEIAYCSPTAFFHDVGEADQKEKGKIVVDLSRKVLIFLDQPHNDLLARLRPLLSHDKKEINIKVTDKKERQGLRTKNVILRGYPAVIFCTAGLRIDEQEATRFLMLSPEVSQEKLEQGITQAIRKASDSKAFEEWLEANPDRILLRERIRAIKQEAIEDVKIPEGAGVREKFLQQSGRLKPRHNRDIKRLMSLIKMFALLNLWWRERDGAILTANAEDVDYAFRLWKKISASQELNLPPYVYNLHHEVILPLWKEKNEGYEGGQNGLTRQEVMQKHYTVYGRLLDGSQLRTQLLPMLETAGLINQEPDPNDKRRMLIYPTNMLESNASDGARNSDVEGGVK